MSPKICKSGFTLVEISASLTIMMIAFGLAFGGFLYALKRSTEGDVQNELDIDVQVSMERLKRDLRLSSLDQIFYYPDGPGPYQAISFPLARDDDGDGLIELDAFGKIIWDKTVVYHIWPSSPHQLRVTTFDPRDNDLTDAQRQEQLESVVKTGAGQGTYNGDDSSYDVIFENLLEWSIDPRQSLMDTYNKTLKREKNSLGYVLLGSGSHAFNFKVYGKNGSSSGYQIGIDQLIVSPCYSPREAEAQTAIVGDGPDPILQYMDSGSWKGNYQFLFPATEVGQNFTFTLDNDRWEETNFRGTGYQAEDCSVVFDETLAPKDFVVQLDGMDDAWTAELQSGSNALNTALGSLTNAVVRIMLKGSELEVGGGWIAYNGRKCRLTFQSSAFGRLGIDNVYIGECFSTNNVSSNYVTTVVGPQFQPVTFGGSSSLLIGVNAAATSDWVDLPIDVEKSYLVTYRIENNLSRDAPKYWKDARAISYGYAYSSWLMENAPVNTETANNWVGSKPLDQIYGLASVEASYPSNGVYTSQIFDTHDESPTYGDISWNSEEPVGTSLSIKERSYGTIAEFASNTNAWAAIPKKSSSSASFTASYKRYVQFQATLESDSNGLYTPQLKDITFVWPGEQTLVEVGGTFTKGTNYGIFELTIDGQPLRSGLTINLQIFKDIYTFNKGTKRVMSSLRADIIPRNSNK